MHLIWNNICCAEIFCLIDYRATSSIYIFLYQLIPRSLINWVHYSFRYDILKSTWKNANWHKIKWYTAFKPIYSRLVRLTGGGEFQLELRFVHSDLQWLCFDLVAWQKGHNCNIQIRNAFPDSTYIFPMCYWKLRISRTRY